MGMRKTIISITFPLLIIIGCISSRKFNNEYKADLTSDNPDIRKEAVIAIAQMETRGNVAVDDLITLFKKEKDADIRRLIIETFRSIKPAVTPQLNDLFMLALHDEDPLVRYASIFVVSEMEIIPSNLIAQLPHYLADPDSLVRTITVQTFQKLGTLGLHPLVRTISKADAETKKLIAVILGRLGEEAIPAVSVLKKLKEEDENADVRAAADEALHYIVQ